MQKHSLQMMPCHQNKKKPSRTSSRKFSCTIDLTLSSSQSQSPPNELYDSLEQLSAPDDAGTLISDPVDTSDDEWRLLPCPLCLMNALDERKLHKMQGNRQSMLQCKDVSVLPTLNLLSVIWMVR